MNLKSYFLVFVLLTFINTTIFSQGQEDTPSQYKVRRIVIDAGHGGGDPGALGSKSKEKDINLSVALKLGQLITENYDPKEVEIIYTRKTDVSVELYKRAEIANKNKADLFVSIHCNAATNKSAQGVEVLVMGEARTEASLAVAKKENAAILLEKNYQNNYEGFDPNFPFANTIFSLQAVKYLKESAELAKMVQDNLVQNTNFRDRKVLQAGFWVLYKVAMPSILIELGFISNVEEETIMLQEATQRVMAQSIYNAIVSYKNKMEGTNKKGIDITPIYKQTAKTPPNVATTVTDPQTTIDTNATPSVHDAIKFRVQFLATSSSIPANDARFKNLDNIKYYVENNLWKYTAGDETSFEAAETLLQTVKNKGFSQAFIVAFHNEKKITVEEARAMLKIK